MVVAISISLLSSIEITFGIFNRSFGGLVHLELVGLILHSKKMVGIIFPIRNGWSLVINSSFLVRKEFFGFWTIINSLLVTYLGWIFGYFNSWINFFGLRQKG